MAEGIMGYPGGLERRDVIPEGFPALPAALKRISWGAVFAGLIVATMVSLILALLGMAIGLSTVNPQEEANPFSGLGMGAAIWWVVSNLIALFSGGWVAGRMAGIPKPFDGALHGVLAWGLATLVTLYLLGTAVGRIVGGVTGMVGQGLSAAGRSAASAAPMVADAVQDKLREQGMSAETVRREAEALLSQTGKPRLQPDRLRSQAGQAGEAARQAALSPQQAQAEMGRILDRLKSQAGVAAEAADREAAINLIVARTGKGKAEAARTVDGWIVTLREARQKVDQAKAQAEQKAREVGDAAASGMSKASLLAFITLLLGGGAAAFGGAAGIPKDAAVPPVTGKSRQ